MTLSKSRSSAVAVAALGLAATFALSGCSAGQISQSASQQPAVNGTLTWVGDPTTGIALRNLHLRAPQTVDYVNPGSSAELLFVAVNESAALPDRLVSITSPVGTVSLTERSTFCSMATLKSLRTQATGSRWVAWLRLGRGRYWES